MPSADQMQWAHPLVRDWFLSRFGSPTEPQAMGWPHILERQPVLVCAPTGSGKTMAAFLVCIDRLVRLAVEGKLEERTSVVYVSPLKALSNDVQKNLEQPLKEIAELARSRGIELCEIRAWVRTGDTLPAERRSFLKHPPHLLVTTPESLYILLTAEGSRQVLKTADTVIVDEIHALAGNKRGCHLSLSLERLEQLCDDRLCRVGLSATVRPVEEIACFLTGAGRKAPAIVDVGRSRQLDLAVEVPPSPLGPVATHEMWEEIYDRITALALEHRSTLVFVNTRKLAERVAHLLSDRMDEELVASHHGSLSRKIRLQVEKRLKAGQLKVLVATSSLELGIDIGHVDLVCQIGSARSIAAVLQRVGRAGHWRGAIPKGRIFATTRDELVEAAACVKAIRQKELDRSVIPRAPRDVLSQQIVADCAAGEWYEEALFARVRRAYPYRDLSRHEFDRVIDMLSEGFAGRNGRHGAYLHRDRVNGILRGRRGSRLVSITNGGAIPETAAFTVVAEPDGRVIGSLDEDFAVESTRGDIVLLGSTSWLIKRVEQRTSRVLVEDARGASPTVPFWRGEAPSRTPELSWHVCQVRSRVHELASGQDSLPGEAVRWLVEHCGVDESGAGQIVEYIKEGARVLPAVPTTSTVIAERFFDESGAMQLVIHAPFGGRINKAWGLALRKRFCRSFNYELQAQATDDGLAISLLEQHSFPLADVFQFLHPNTVEEVLVQASLPSPVFATRWRWAAGRSLAVLRFQGGRKVPPYLQRMRSDDLLSSVFPQAAACQDNVEGDIILPSHPLVDEAIDDVLHEAMDVDGLKDLLSRLISGEIKCLAVDTPVPSVFSHEILNANPYAYLDDAPLEERRARAVEMRRVLPPALSSEIGRLDPEAVALVRQECWPDVRNADELCEFLRTVVVFPRDLAVRESAPGSLWESYWEELVRARRALEVKDDGRVFWVDLESAAAFKLLKPSSLATTLLPESSPSASGHSRQESVLAAVAGWLNHLGPTSSTELAGILSVPEPEVEQALGGLEASGRVLRGYFTSPSAATLEWCERRLLSRIHRLTVGSLRKMIEPVSAAVFYRWLLSWHHVLPGTQLSGERGTLEVLAQLQGFEAPANAWESDILCRRISNYTSDFLDRLCLTGAVGWGRLSPHPAFASGASDGQSPSRIVPTSAAPITFFLRDQAEWMGRRWAEDVLPPVLSRAGRQIYAFLKQHGASFFADLARMSQAPLLAASRVSPADEPYQPLLKSEIESGLWELVTAGLVTADGFDNLRALIDPRRRAGQGRGRYARPRHGAGRWSILHDAVAGERQTIAESACFILLKRYGVVFRDLLFRETNMPLWRELVPAMRRLEDRGEVRGGRFVDGFSGEQFALPLAVESLRAARLRPPESVSVRLAAADPLNLSGVLVPGERLSATASRAIRVIDGVSVVKDG